MTLEKYESARMIRCDINDINKEMDKIDVLKKKYIEDKDLQWVLEFAFSTYFNKIQDLERDFLIL